MNGFVAPKVRVGDRVLVDATPRWSAPLLGFCQAIHGDGSQIDIVYWIGGATRHRLECYHRHDPICADLPQRFDPAFAGEINGVWDIAPQEAEHRQLMERMVDLEATVQRLLQAETRRNEIAADPEEPKFTPPPVERRGPGRPRKVPMRIE